MAFSFGTWSNIARRADEERDLGNWRAASELYRLYLDKAGYTRRSFKYIVQLGNCLKESGDYSGSLKAYDEAIKLNAKDSDLYLQRGHVLKLMGRVADALISYQTSLALDPTNEHARFEAEEAKSVKPLQGATEIVEAAHTIWFDVTDFMEYVRHNVSLSGIQRVLANLALYIKNFKVPGYRIIPVIPEYDRFRVLAADVDSFLELVDLFNDPIVQRHRIDELSQIVYDGRRQVFPKKDDIFVIAGAFWIYPHYDVIMHLRTIGMRFGLFIHDLLQIRMPEYVQKTATDKFNIQLSDALDFCDFVLANSQYVANDIIDYIESNKNYKLPVKAVILPTELREHAVATSVENRDIRDMVDCEYVLCVSTIEVRKNHKLLIKIWEKLREEFGEKTPYLVFVGKWGWQIEKVRSYLDEKGYIGDWLYVFNGISDAEVEYLYKNCLFTVYPSFAEGFGLPIGESLAYGKPCIAANTTSMPEVGGEFVRYIDPFDWEASYPVIRQALVDRDDLARWQEWIRTDFQPKTWAQFCSEFFSSVVDHGQALLGKPPRANCSLPQGRVILGGEHDILQMAQRNEPIITFRAARQLWWNPANHWGAWSQRRRSEIAFQSEFGEGDAVDVFLRLHRDSSREGSTYAVVNAGANDQVIELSEHPSFFRFSGVVGTDGLITIQLLARGKYPSHDPSGVFIGWSGIAYCRHGDVEASARTLEAIVVAGKPLSEFRFETPATEPLD